MKEKISELFDRFFNEGNMSINELERELLALCHVSKRSSIPWFLIGFIIGLLTTTIVVMGAI